MSINVNVSGNPVKIHRGKMVTADPEYVTKEFQKRRHMRLEQVRQQSKDIAETVRNRVRNETSKQLSDVEKRGEKELKKWQARKLLHLQQQYRECLKDIGLGHSEAAVEEESDYALESRKESYNKIAKERGQHAIDKLQREKSQELDNKATGFQKRRYNQLVEGARAKMVADLNKTKKSKKNPFKKKKKKVSTDINISSRLSSDSESESEVPELLNLSSSSSNSSGIPRKRIAEHTVSNPSTIVEEPTEKTTSSEPSKQNLLETPAEENVTAPAPSQLYSLDDGLCTGYHYPVDTRISDRIKTRTLLGSANQKRSENCDISPGRRTAHTIVSDQKISPVSSPKKLSVAKKSRSKTAFSEEVPIAVSENNYVAFKSASNIQQEEIPNKPSVTLRSMQQKSTAQLAGESHTKRQSFSNRRKLLAQSTRGGPNLNKVQYYDHRNRFTKEYPEDKSRVQRIPEESIEVCPSDRSEAEFIERIYKRDRDAEIRGQKAMEKEKVHRDYKEMMKQLPQLQKKERIASIPLRKSKFHMSEDRLRELEKKRQSHMEDVYERLFPTARLITLPTKTEQKATTSTLPYANIDVEDMNVPSLNVGTWEHDFQLKTIPDTGPKHVESNLMRETAEKALGEISDPEKSDLERKENLQKMLKSLKSHRDKLAKELSTLPETSNLHKLVGELGNIDDIIGLGKTADSTDVSTKRRKRLRDSRKSKSQKSDQGKASSSSCLSPCHSLKKSPKNQDEKDFKFSRYHMRCTSASSSSPSPPSKIASTVKPKTERKVKRSTKLILQNTSTQTTPTVERTDDAKKQEKEQRPVSPSKLPVSDSKRPLTKPVICDNKNLKPCDCNLHVHDGKMDVCEIVIKISEDKKPEICVSPIKARDKNIIIKAGTDEIVAVKSPEKKSATIDKLKEEKEKSKAKSPELQPSKPTVESYEKEKKPDKPKPIIELKKPKSKEKVGTSWREYLSQNSNSSTSYFSPPDFTSTCIQKPPYSEYDAPKIKPTGQLTNILKEKPQQSNIQDYSPASSSIIQSNKLVEQQLLSYIKRLLTMSHKSVDDLAVSSVSEMSTPGSSIINVQTNIHLNQFEDIISHFNLNASYPFDNSRHYNTIASSSKSTSNTYTSGTISSDTQQTSHDVRDTALDEFSAENYPDVLAVYNKLAENCAKKIENLATLIERVRLEKLDIFGRSPESGSDKENSTKYLDLPTTLKTQQSERKDTRRFEETDKKGQSSDSLTEQEELNRQLLEIDYSFAEQLKKMTPEEIREQYPLSSSTNSSSSHKEDSQQRDSIEQELLTRLQNLKEGDKAEADSKKEYENYSYSYYICCINSIS
ncbi:hypothetical protein ILUMI_24809 [Ignelater luminosus]|uniref:Uncharacterized protein n=1 Tax=Ignelater luminosus TaxID=2038154 RepID=A0A8K0C9T1_IGNLU|nr:hypothetical protein ILUMI_24809 [Ignelater luminosus]